MSYMANKKEGVWEKEKEERRAQAASMEGGIERERRGISAETGMERERERGKRGKKGSDGRC